MSGLNSVKSSAKNTIVYDFDFLKHEKSSTGMSVEKRQLKVSPYFRDNVYYNVSESAYPRQFYLIGERVFAFTNYSKIGEYKDNLVKEISLRYYSKQPELLAVNDGGVSKILVVNEQEGEILGERIIDFDYSLGSFLTYINKRIFYSKDNLIYFTEEFDYVSQIESSEPVNYIKLDQDLGRVEGMYAIGQKLQVVCTHGIVVLTLGVSPENYQIKRINSGELEVIPNSIVTHGNHVCFLSDINFCIFDGVSVKSYPLFKKTLNVITSGEHVGFYLVNYLENITNKTMVIEIATRQIFNLPYFLGISKKGGYAKSPSGKACVFSRELNGNDKCYYESSAIDFDSAKEKRLVGIEAYAFGRTELTITGDFGELFLEISGYQEYKCNEKSKRFFVNCEMIQGSMPFQNLKLKYRIVGE